MDKLKAMETFVAVAARGSLAAAARAEGVAPAVIGRRLDLLEEKLGVKLMLLVLYIVLGSLALKRAPTPGLQRAGYAGALAVYLFMVSVAMAHHPLGFFRPGMAHAG